MTNDREKTQPLIDPGAGREETLRTNDGIVATAFGLTDVGMQRKVNQDTLGNRVGQHTAQASTLGLLYAVADGMGGHARGEVASALAIQHLFGHYYSADPGEDPRRGLERVLLETNAAVHQAGREAGGAAMGTTLTLALLRDGALYVGNIGDSRTYCIRNGQIQQLTHDHSLIGEQVRSGLLTEAQARQSSIRNVITRAVGYREEVEPDVFSYQVMVGDIVLLCSDGLHSMVDSQELAQHFSTQPLGVAVPALIELAKQRGGPDNITALAVRIDALPPAARSQDDAVTAPLTPSLDDAPTKPFARPESDGAGNAEVKAATAAATTVPLSQPPPSPRAAPAPPPMSPVPTMPPSSAPPAARSSARMSMGLLLVVPLLLLAVLVGGIFVFNQTRNGESPATASAGASSPTASPANPTASNPITLPVVSAVSSGPSSIAAAPVPTASATPTLSAVGAVTATPRASAAVATPSSTAPDPPAPSAAAGSSITNNTGVLIGGTITFDVPPAPGGEWTVMVFRLADLPGESTNPQPSSEVLAGVTEFWSAPVAVNGRGPFNYEIQGDWKGSGTTDPVIIVLRYKANATAQPRFLYPEEDMWQATLHKERATTGHQLRIAP